jgi:hypothetical protein
LPDRYGTVSAWCHPGFRLVLKCGDGVVRQRK